MPDEIINQHLIDPELCIRCNTCEESCPTGAITNDGRNYVVNPETCNACMACVPDCPTGSINNWRPVVKAAAYSVAEQLQWEQLPEPAALPAGANIEPTVSAGRGAPPSAAHPVENLYTRDHPALAVVKASIRLTAETSPSEIRHIVLDVGKDFPFLEGQSVGIIPAGLDANGRRFVMRLYSVASARCGEQGAPGHLALTVKRVIEDHAGQPHHGICSNYVCDLRPGDSVEVVGPYGASYLMPDDAKASLMMICTGTGIAPMRAMIEQRLHNRAATQGQQILFYGGRTPDELPYHAELGQLPDGFLDLNLAFSRLASQPKKYVQDVLRSRHETIARMLADEQCYIYLCGLKGMETGVIEAFQAICTEHGLDWSKLEENLTAQCRLHIETY